MASGTTELIVDHARPFVELGFPDADRRAIAWLDTGGGAVLIGTALAHDLGVTPVRRELDGEEHEVLDLPAIEVASTRLDVSEAIAVKWSDDLIVEGFRAEAFIPARVMAQHVVVFDYPGRSFSVDKPGEPIGTRVEARSLQRPGTGWPAITVELAGETINLLLDTGASCCMLSDRVIERLGSKALGRKSGAFGLANMTAGDLDTKVETVRFPDLVWGDVHVPGVVAVSRPVGNFENMMSSGMPVLVEGAIAGNVLQHLRVEWQARDQAVWIHAPAPIEDPLCQVPLVLHATEGAMRVVAVGDEAASMGFRVNDDVVSVDGQSTTRRTFGQVVAMISGTPGQRREVTVRRGGESVTIDAEVVSVV